MIRIYFGEVSEWFKEAVSKTVVREFPYRGFESHPLRQTKTKGSAVAEPLVFV
jgi:hypothetical protein